MGDVHEDGRAVVVGVDGSDRARDAAVWAAQRARPTGATVRLVTATAPAGRHLGDAGGPGYDADLRREAAHGRLAAAAALVHQIAPEVPVGQVIRDGDPVAVLTAESATAALLVLGNSAHRGIGGVLAGSVLTALTGRTHCPLVAVRGSFRGEEGGPVVVGVDGSPASEAALAFAFTTAAEHGTVLVAAHTWIDAPAGGSRSWAAVEEQEREVLAERLAGWAEKYPEVEVRRVAGRDRPANTLVELADGARLVVLGSRRRGPVAGALLGSVGREVLHRARCPVAVVPGATR
ncbi:universal stress protein [Pseudonocardia sp. RS010]|uniref:universal stress protein n=1 Tax=Pseudonocardia sp. RS010 TaxID=3385979 RepID=UPI0039A272CA